MKLVNTTELSKGTRDLLAQKNLDPKTLAINNLGHASSTQITAPKATLTTAELLLDKSRVVDGNSNTNNANRKLSVRTSPSRLRADTMYKKANSAVEIPVNKPSDSNLTTLPPIRESNSAPVLVKSDKSIAKLNTKLSMIVNAHIKSEEPINNTSNEPSRRSVISRVPLGNIQSEKLTRRSTRIDK